MTNVEILQQKIAESGLKKAYLAKRLGLSPAGFRNCCMNRAEFRASHIQILCEELHIFSLEEREKIFFGGKKSQKKSKKVNK